MDVENLDKLLSLLTADDKINTEERHTYPCALLLEPILIIFENKWGMKVKQQPIILTVLIVSLKLKLNSI